METSIKFGYQFTGSRSKPTILLLHGFMGRGSDWAEIAKRLRKNFSTLLVDLPGHGNTEANSREAYRMENCASAIVDLLDKLKLERVHMVGYSMGGRLALFLLINFPGRFDKSVLESASAGLETEAERVARRDSDQLLAAKIKHQGLEDFLLEWYRRSLFGNLAEDRKLLSDLIEKRLKNSPDRLALSLEMMGIGRQPNLWPRLPEIAVPVLLLAGELDQKYAELNRRMCDLCRKGQVAIIEKTGHNLHYQKLDEFVRHACEFLLKEQEEKKE